MIKFFLGCGRLRFFYFFFSGESCFIFLFIWHQLFYIFCRVNGCFVKNPNTKMHRKHRNAARLLSPFVFLTDAFNFKKTLELQLHVDTDTF